jgi:adenylate cyclase
MDSSQPEIPAGAQEINVAVLFADVAGSTRLYEQLGDAQALATISQCLELARECGANYGGRLVKTIGDEAMLVFPVADQAAAAAAEIQSRMVLLGKANGVKLAFRIGFHFGGAIERDGDVFGDSVNTAARLVSLAKGGQIILSDATAQAMSTFMRRTLRELDLVSLKGKEHGVRIVELVWNDPSDLTTLVSAPKARAVAIELEYGGRTTRLEANASMLSLGRSDENDVVIADKRASRHHARIERRHDKVVLVDQSSNGTYVTFDGEQEFMLHRQEIALRGHGQICFGHSRSAEASDPVSFDCVESG